MLNWVALDKIFKCLGHPWRRFMVETLCDAPAQVTEFAEILPLSLPAILQHLRLLEDSGLIRTEKTRGIRICRIEPQGLRLLDQWLTPRRRLWDRHLQELIRRAG